MTTKNSGEIKSDIEGLVRAYEATVKVEVKDLDSTNLARLARNQTSNWSGGHSVTNMVEQIVRIAALDQLQRILDRLPTAPYAPPVSILD